MSSRQESDNEPSPSLALVGGPKLMVRELLSSLNRRGATILIMTPRASTHSVRTAR